MKIATAGAALLVLAACTPSSQPRSERAVAPPAAPATDVPAPPAAPAANPPTPPAAPVDRPAEAAAGEDSATIMRLEREARAIAKAGPCADAGGCRTAPVGNRPCGGPRAYIVYCAATTDTTALFAKLRELARAEDEYNRRMGLGSTCEFRMPPETTLTGGTCRAVETQ